MESQPSFASLGRVAAIEKLYAECPFKGARNGSFACKNGRIESVSRLLTEGIDFDLSYFPFKHLGYKSVVEATAMLYARFAMPRCLNINLAVSAKLDFAQIQQLWEGICLAAKDYAYESVSLDIAASLNGLCIALSADGFIKDLDAKRRPAPKSKDLLCLSGNVGGAFLGMQILQREKAKMADQVGHDARGVGHDARGVGHDARGVGHDGKGLDGVTPGLTGGLSMPGLEKHKLLVGDYLRPVLDADIPKLMADAGFYPALGVCVDKGLSDAVKRLSGQCGLGAKIYLDRIPFGGGLFEAAKELQIDAASTALNGGEDWRVLFTLPIDQFEKFRHDLQTWQVIGHLALPEAGASLVMPDGVELPLRAQGWKEDEA